MANNTQRSMRGFTLIEVMITIVILTSIVMAVSTMLRGSFDIRAAVAEQSQITQRAGVAMYRIATDVQHAFHLSRKDQVRNGVDRSFKTLFRIEPRSEGDVFELTTMTHIPLTSGNNESTQTLVHYEIRKDPQISSRSNLYRSELPRVPLDFKDIPKGKLFARGIKSLHITPWIGDDWGKDGWDTGRRDFQNTIPQMVRIELEVWTTDLDPEQPDSTDQSEASTIKLTTIIHPASSFGMEEIKSQTGTIRWDKL